jgi:Ca-activated chloride channel family protein
MNLIRSAHVAQHLLSPSLLGRAATLLVLLGTGCSQTLAPHEAPKTLLPSAAPEEVHAEPARAAGIAHAKDESSTQSPAPRAVEASAKRAAPAKSLTPSATSQALAGAAPAGQSGTGLLGLGLKGLGSAGGGIGFGAGSGAGRLGGAHLARSRLQMNQPHADFNTENYAHIAQNAFLNVADQPLSTFSIDVDTASYSNARRFLNDGRLPPKDAIRVEEWLNYFGYDYPEPAAHEPFSVTSEVSTCPWNAAHRLLRLGLKSQQISQAETPARNLVFLVDVSGSMMPENKLPLLKRGLSLLAETLREKDTISIVVYAGASGLALPATSGNDRARVLDALGRLEAGGSTNGGDGIRLAYAIARQHLLKGGINRVILATDGDFNVGTSSEGELQRLIEGERKSGVFLTVLGFGDGNVKDSTMEMLADKGNGNYAYIDSIAEARKVLVREAGSTLITVAKDVKLQVEFNPARVAGYQLIGYENRLLQKEDFNDDQKDAGELGAGHAVTALYEIVPKGEQAPPPKVDPLKYQTPPGPAAAAASNELLTVNVRYKLPTSEVSAKFSRVVTDGGLPLAESSADFRFSAAVAEAALVLRGAPNLPGASLEAARALAEGALGHDIAGDRHEFVSLLAKARALVPTPGALATRTN